jgi:hypothetical protein
MSSNEKKPYSKPQFVIYGPMEVITQSGGSGGIDGIIGIDIDGDGTIGPGDVPTGVTTGSL